jgi:putative hydrolase of the HAD superfamily
MKETQKITTLFLDIGGVLLSNGWGHEFRHKAAEKFNLDIPEMEARHKRIFEKYEEGDIETDKLTGDIH